MICKRFKIPVFNRINHRGNAIAAPVVITPLAVEGTFADGQQGEDYSASLPITGGLGPYTVSLLSGSIPPGFTLEVVGNELVLSGSDPN